MTRERALLAASLLACLALVLWIRLLPLSLPIVDDWAADVAGRPGYPADRAEAARLLRAELTFEGADGRPHVYLGDFDSYHWLRMARNHLERGTVCDAVVNGQCRDTLATAPVGSRMIYTRSVHVAAIVAMHRIATFFDPRVPLSTSAYLVPVIVGLLGVIPAFLIGRALGGLAGGVVAAVLISLNTVYLERSLGSDNDVWNVVLPLFVLWAVLAALSAEGRLRPVLYAALAGGVTALHATTWRGWLFAYAVVLCALVAQVVLAGVRHAARERTLRVWQAPGLATIVLVGVTFYASTAFLMWLVGYERAYLSAFSMLIGDEVAPAEPGYWPYVLQTVAEFAKPGLRTIVRAAGGLAVFFVGLAGLVLLFVPAERRRWRHVAGFAVAMAVPVYVVAAGGAARNLTVLLVASALAVPVLARVFDDDAPAAPAQAQSMVLLGWFVAALLFSFEGTRFVTLLILPLAVAIGVVARRLDGRPLARVAVLAGLVLLAAQPVRQGYAAARNYVPGIDDAWWLTLERVRRESPPDTIVNTWWDYGYWVKYVAERRVSSTGGTLLTHVPHWMAKALTAHSERETLGLLRMLNCGSDAMPLREGRHGAYGKIVATGRDAVTAYAIVLGVVGRDRADAQAYLAGRGFTPAEQTAILESTHCAPPDSYLILTSDLLTKSPAWLYLGTWDMRRAHLERQARARPQAEVVAEMVSALDYSAQEAAALYAGARAIKSKADLDAFVAPHRGKLFTRWHACREARAGARLTCAIDVAVGPEGVSTFAFVYDPASPQTGRLARGDADAGLPSVIVVAGAQRLDETVAPSPSHADLGILVDVPNRRILAGMPDLLRSSFTHLMYLDGRYATRLEKFDDRTTRLGNRVVTWKVRWP